MSMSGENLIRGILLNKDHRRRKPHHECPKQLSIKHGIWEQGQI